MILEEILEKDFGAKLGAMVLDRADVFFDDSFGMLDFFRQEGRVKQYVGKERRDLIPVASERHRLEADRVSSRETVQACGAPLDDLGDLLTRQLRGALGPSAGKQVADAPVVLGGIKRVRKL